MKLTTDPDSMSYSLLLSLTTLCVLSVHYLFLRFYFFLLFLGKSGRAKRDRPELWRGKSGIRGEMGA